MAEQKNRRVGRTAAQRADGAPHELARGRLRGSRLRAGRSGRHARVCRRVAPARAGLHGRARQQSAGARRRFARHRDFYARRARRNYAARAARSPPRPACHARSSRALPPCTNWPAPSSWPVFPGTVGGALAMNAGCYGGETWGIVDKRHHARPRGPAAPAHARELRHRLSQRDPARWRRGMVRRGAFHASRAAMAGSRARPSNSCSSGASPRSRSISPTPARCSAIRPTTTRRA